MTSAPVTPHDAEASRPQAFTRVCAFLAAAGHPHPPHWLNVAARTSQEAADALGVAVGRIAKSVVFKRLADERAVLVVASGDRRVDEAKLSALAGPLGRADAAFVKARTGFVIGGVAPVAHSEAPLLFLDRDLQRFASVWAAAGHPNGVFEMSPAQLHGLTAAPWADLTHSPQ